MTYYDDFERDCGCRMHCVCPKTKWCDICQASTTHEHIGSHQWICLARGHEKKRKARYEKKALVA